MRSCRHAQIDGLAICTTGIPCLRAMRARGKLKSGESHVTNRSGRHVRNRCASRCRIQRSSGKRGSTSQSPMTANRDRGVREDRPSASRCGPPKPSNCNGYFSAKAVKTAAPIASPESSVADTMTRINAQYRVDSPSVIQEITSPRHTRYCRGQSQ